MKSLEAASLKLERANEHLERIQKEAVAFLETKPYRVVVNPDLNAGDQILHIQADREPPVEWGVLIGDCLHNLRSALDSMAWDMGLLRSSTPPDNIQFPICFDLHAFNSEAGRRLTGISQGAVAIIERYQPYHRWNNPVDDDFWLLRRLSNVDKHQVLNLAAMSYGGRYGFRGGIRIPVERYALVFMGLVENGTEVGRVRGLEPEVEVYDDPAFKICFGEGSPAAGHDVVGLLSDILKLVRGVRSSLDHALTLKRI